jgi:hypothetical protein
MTLSDLARTSWIATMSNLRTTLARTSTTCGLEIFDSPNTWMLKVAIVMESLGLPPTVADCGDASGCGGTAAGADATVGGGNGAAAEAGAGNTGGEGTAGGGSAACCGSNACCGSGGGSVACGGTGSGGARDTGMAGTDSA